MNPGQECKNEEERCEVIVISIKGNGFTNALKEVEADPGLKFQ